MRRHKSDVAHDLEGTPSADVQADESALNVTEAQSESSVFLMCLRW